MSLVTLEKRLRILEMTSTRLRLGKRSRCRSPQLIDGGAGPWLGELEELKQEATLITEQAKTAGDLPTAIASIRVRCCITELAARLRGDLDERSPTNILNITLDPESARRIAQTYLERHKPLEVESR
jgi:hypothetical protein